MGTDSFVLIMGDEGIRVERYNDWLQPNPQIIPAADFDKFFIDGQPLVKVVAKKFRQISGQ